MSMRSFAKVLPRLRDARDGGVSVLFGLALIPVVGAVGLAIDYGASVRIRSMLKASTDAAALAGVNAITNGGDPSAIATSFMNAKLAGTGLTPTVNVTVNTGSATVQVAATLAHGNSFMGALGISTTNIAVHSTASAGAGGGPVEVAISFDTTGSMAGSKMTAAQDAAQQLVETLFAVPGSTSQNSNVSVGLVPFSSYVNVGTAYRGASWLTNSTDYSETKYECWDTYPNATYTNPVPRSGTCYNDGLPYTCTWTDYTVNYGTAVNVVEQGAGADELLLPRASSSPDQEKERPEEGDQRHERQRGDVHRSRPVVGLARADAERGLAVR